MPDHASDASYLPYLIPVVFIVLVILRNARERNLRVERLWFGPVMIIVAVAMSFSHQRPPSPPMLALDAVALLAGGALGWWRGRLTHITVDPETHQLTSRTSAFGMIVILGVFALRFGLRFYATQNAGALHISIVDVTDIFLMFAVGLVCAQRLEIALRATRLLNEARAGKG